MKTHAYSKNLAPKRRRKKDSTSEHYVDNAKLYEVMEELNLFANLAQTEVKAMFCHLDENGRNLNYALANELRKEGISLEVFPDIKKLPKQFEYAEKKGIPLVIITGDDEISSGQLSFKNLITKEQGKIGRNELGGFLK